MTPRPGPIAILVLVALGHLGPSTARAEPTRDNLVQRALGFLRDAEQRYDAGNREGARELAVRARVLLDQAHRLAPRDLETLFLLVQAAVFSGDRESAGRWLQLYQRTSAKGYQDPPLAYASAMAYLYLENRPDRALAELARLEQLDARWMPRPRQILRFKAMLRHGILLRGARRYGDAIDALRQATVLAVEVGGEDRLAAARRAQMDTYIDWARALSSDGEHAQAAEPAEKAVAIARLAGDRLMLAIALNAYGTMLHRTQRLAETEEVFRELHALDPQNPLWSFQLGLTIANQARFEDAVEFYELTIRLIEAHPEGAPPLPPDVLGVHLRLGNARRNLAGAAATATERARLLAASRRSLEHYVELREDDPMGHYWLGILLDEDLHEPHAAMKHLARAYALDPVCDRSLARIVQIMARVGPEPEPGVDPAEAEAAWDTRHETLLAELREHREERAAIRAERQRRTGDLAEGCN